MYIFEYGAFAEVLRHHISVIEFWNCLGSLIQALK